MLLSSFYINVDISYSVYILYYILVFISMMIIHIFLKTFVVRVCLFDQRKTCMCVSCLFDHHLSHLVNFACYHFDRFFIFVRDGSG